MSEKADGPSGVGGWLLLLCRLLLVYQPLSLAVTTSAALASMPTRGAGLLVAIAIRILVTAITVAAGLALTNRHPDAVALANAALALSAACDVFIYTTPYFPNNRPPGDTPFYVAASLAYHAAWLVYLSRSARVRNTY
jgi:Protein of unknown function (DUF2569)